MRSLWLFLFATSLYCHGQQNLQEKQMDSIFSKLNTSAGPGCAVAVIRDGAVIFKKGYGMANLEYKAPITTASIFDIASLSKQFTGFAISSLIEQHKISESDDIRKWLPDVPDFGKTITIRHLVHHTSGLRDWPEALHAAGWQYWEECSFDDIMRMVRNQRELDFEPGSQYSYSNTGYNLLAALVAKVTGKSFRQWTNENIFVPLGMTSSIFLDNSDEVIPNLVSSYYPDSNRFGKIPDVLTAYGSSSLFTSVDDLTKWVIHFQKALADKDPVFTRMVTGDLLNNGDKNNYGYGVQLASDRDLPVVQHTGSWAGFRTIIKNYPVEKFSVILLSNGNDGSFSGTYSKAVVDVFLGQKFAEMPKQAAAIEPPVIHPDSLSLKRFEGVYAWGGDLYFAGPGYVTIQFQKDHLGFQYSGEDFYPMDAISDSSFWIAAADLPIIFRKDAAGKIKTFVFRNQDGLLIPPFSPEFKDLAQYTGTYSSAELHTSYSVDIQKGKLWVHHFRTGDSEMSPHLRFADSFIAGPGKLSFYRNQKNAIAGFRLSGERVRNIRFDKTR